VLAKQFENHVQKRLKADGRIKGLAVLSASPQALFVADFKRGVDERVAPARRPADAIRSDAWVVHSSVQTQFLAADARKGM
jgi:hypothetical protein